MDGVGGTSLAIALIFGGVAVWQRRKARRDLTETNYLRTTGPVAVGGKEIAGSADEEDTTATLNTLDLFDRSLPLSAGQAGDLKKKLANVSWGTVDYAAHLQVILEIRDAEGRSVYRHPRFSPGE